MIWKHKKKIKVKRNSIFIKNTFKIQKQALNISVVSKKLKLKTIMKTNVDMDIKPRFFPFTITRTVGLNNKVEMLST
jgi:hypothetical protein